MKNKIALLFIIVLAASSLFMLCSFSYPEVLPPLCLEPAEPQTPGSLTATLVGDVDAVYDKRKNYTLTVTPEYVPIGANYVLSYKWYHDLEEISGQTAPTLNVGKVPDSGSYYCRVSVSDGEHNTHFDTAPVTVSIRPREVDISNIAWDYKVPFMYDGTEHFVSVTGLDEDIVPNYSTYKSTYEPTTYKVKLAGKYLTYVSFSYDKENIKLIGGAFRSTVEWEILKSSYDMSGVKFADRTVTFTGQKFDIQISGELPAGVKVSYTEGGVFPGEYEIIATFTSNDVNYEPIPEMKATLTILSLNEVQLGDSNFTYKSNDGEILLEIIADKPLPAGITLSLLDVSEKYSGTNFSAVTPPNAHVNSVDFYDICFMENDKQAELLGSKFTVRLLIPKALREAEELIVVHISDDGEMSAVSGASRNGDYMEFRTGSFSVFTIIEVNETPQLLWLLIILLILAIILVIALVLRAPATPSPTPAAPLGTKDSFENFFVSGSEENSDEALTDCGEIPCDEIVPGEKDTPTSESRSDSDSDFGMNGVPIMLDGHVVYVRYRSSFSSRLIQSEEKTKDFYSRLKNYILSYKKIKSRTSWSLESFRLLRRRLITLDVRGKTLIVNFALPPERYLETKYKIKDSTSRKKYEDVPSQMKLRSERALRYAMELVDVIMAENDIRQGDIRDESYAPTYKTNEELVECGLMKRILPRGVVTTDNTLIERADISKLIGMASTPE